MYVRILEDAFLSKYGKGKALILFGPRQVGKTTLIKKILEDRDYLFLDGDNPTTRELLTSPNMEELKNILGTAQCVFIDEAQRMPDVGLTLKMITDQFVDVQLLVSGSSSFELSNKLNEPLTGRKWEYELFPISWAEYELQHGYLYAKQQLENRLLHGFYPEVLNHPEEERDYLQELVNSYLFKDILAYADIRKPEILENLLQALALQVGSEVSYSELSRTVGVDKKTIQKYISILEKGYIIFKLGSYSSNLRTELRKSKKIYFIDNGVRNMILGNFAPLNLRQDKGALWENFLISERYKMHKYQKSYTKMYFWRTRQQQEVDLIEVKDGQLSGFEFKWKANKNQKFPKTFIDAYEPKLYVIDRKNFRNLIN